MTALQAYEFALTEINKLGSPDILREEFVYIFNKSIYNYINSRYNFYEINQQLSDDLRVLRGSIILNPVKSSINKALYKGVYQVDLPRDYFHILSCIVEYELNKDLGCAPKYKKGNIEHHSARRLSSDKWSAIQNNAYLKPSYKLPYFYIHNSLPVEVDTVTNVQAGDRPGNSSTPILEIRYGDDSTFKIKDVYIDYLRTPQYVELTQEQIDSETDTSQVLEFPEYVCLEIIKEFSKLLLEHSSNPRLQTNPLVNQSIAPPFGLGGG